LCRGTIQSRSGKSFVPHSFALLFPQRHIHKRWAQFIFGTINHLGQYLTMDFKVNFRPDISYYKEAYSEIVKNNGLKRFEPVFATVLILVGIGLFYYDKSNALSFVPILFSGLGVFELIRVYTSRNKWVNDRVKSGVTGQEIQLEFTDDLIIHSGPFSNGTLKWTGIKSVGQTEKGIIIKPETGTVIYLPKMMFESKGQVDLILSKGKK